MSSSNSKLLQLHVVSILDNKCGGILSSMKGEFATPNHPLAYPSNSNCLWIINVPLVKGIEIEYVDFNLEKGNDCDADRMTTVAAAPSRKARECGLSVRMKTVMGNLVMVEFVSNGRVEKRGFKAIYNSLFLVTNRLPLRTTTSSTRFLTTIPGLKLYFY